MSPRKLNLHPRGLLLRTLVLCLAVMLGALYAQTDYSITVKAGERQTFAGFGSSQVSKEFGHFPPEPFRSEMADLVYRDLKAQVLRLWVDTRPELSPEEMKEGFYADYLDNGVLDLIRKRGVKTLLLAPHRGMAAPKDSLSEYARKIAQFISDLKEERGIEISATGIANEPEGWSGEQVRDTIKFLRRELDLRKLQNVEIIAPENPGANEIFDAQLDVIRADREAWNSLAGISSHSYNMAARESGASRSEGKSYWMTEASDDGSESGEDESRASTIAARFLNDLNHLVTHWIFFKGFSYSQDVAKDDYSASRITQYDASKEAIVTHLKYHYLRQIVSTFDVGAVMRRSESATEGDMVYTYGQKPRLCAAAGRNPDGSWCIALVNITGVAGSNAISQWHPPGALNVSISIEELAGSGEHSFQVYRSRAGHHFVPAGSVTMKDGAISLPIAPMELVSLRSLVP